MRVLSRWILASSLALVGCSGANDFPKDSVDALVAESMDPRCRLVSVESVQALATTDDLQRVAVRYAADCVPEGGKLSRRLQATMTFRQRHEWFGFKPWTMAHNLVEQDPPRATATAATALPTVPASTATPALAGFADSPECDATLRQVAQQVVPCLRQVHPESAQHIEDWLLRAGDEYRLRGDVSNRDAVLMQLDEGCLQQWRYRNKLLADDAAYLRVELTLNRSPDRVMQSEGPRKARF